MAMYVENTASRRHQVVLTAHLDTGLMTDRYPPFRLDQGGTEPTQPPPSWRSVTAATACGTRSPVPAPSSEASPSFPCNGSDEPHPTLIGDSITDRPVRTCSTLVRIPTASPRGELHWQARWSRRSSTSPGLGEAWSPAHD
jgi:hypothetical protein